MFLYVQIIEQTSETGFEKNRYIMVRAQLCPCLVLSHRPRYYISLSSILIYINTSNNNWLYQINSNNNIYLYISIYINFFYLALYGHFKGLDTAGSFTFQLITSITLPSQGFWNAILWTWLLRKKYTSKKRKGNNNNNNNNRLPHQQDEEVFLFQNSTVNRATVSIPSSFPYPI